MESTYYKYISAISKKKLYGDVAKWYSLHFLCVSKVASEMQLCPVNHKPQTQLWPHGAKMEGKLWRTKHDLQKITQFKWTIKIYVWCLKHGTQETSENICFRYFLQFYSSCYAFQFINVHVSMCILLHTCSSTQKCLLHAFVYFHATKFHYLETHVSISASQRVQLCR